MFVEHDGFSVLLRAMQTSDERLQTKAAFMMRAMCASRPQFKGASDRGLPLVTSRGSGGPVGPLTPEKLEPPPDFNHGPATGDKVGFLGKGFLVT